MIKCKILHVRECSKGYSIYAEDEAGGRLMFNFNPAFGIPIQGDTIGYTCKHGCVVPLTLNDRVLKQP